MIGLFESLIESLYSILIVNFFNISIVLIVICTFLFSHKFFAHIVILK
jgi:hypothetical protein